MSTAYAVPSPVMFFQSGYEPASASSSAIREAWEYFQKFVSDSAVDWLADVDARLHQLEMECSETGWDGEGAKAIDRETIQFASRIASALFAALPQGIPAPDVLPERDGDVCFEWTVDPKHLFAMSLGAHHKVNFAGRFGSLGERHGLQPVGENPQSDLVDIVAAINRLFRSKSIDRVA